MLDQPVGAGAVTAGGGDDLPHRVPLVEAGEEGPRTAIAVGDVHEGSDEVQPGRPLPDLFPQVGGGVAVTAGRVAGATLLARPARALVEGEKPGVLPGEVRGHVDLVRIGREVHECPGAEDPVGGVPVAAVLVDRVRDALVGKGVLQLRRRRRDAVDHEHEVEAVRGRGLRVVELAHDAAADCLVARHQIRGEGVGRREEAGAEGDAVHLERAAEHGDRTAVVELGRDVRGHLDARVRLATEPDRELLPLLRLGVGDEAEQLVGEKPELAVVGGGRQRRPPVIGEVVGDVLLERGLGVDAHAPPRSRCITAAAPGPRPSGALRAYRGASRAQPRGWR